VRVGVPIVLKKVNKLKNLEVEKKKEDIT